MTSGFRDLLFVGRQTRPSLYNLRARRPAPVVPRELTYEIDERTTWDGRIEREVIAEQLTEVARNLEADRVEAVAVCFLHSYANPSNERTAEQILRSMLPNIMISLSSEVCPQMGEYERATTCALNAYVAPAITRYLAALTAEFARVGKDCPVYTMQSNGGTMTTDMVTRRSVHTLLSGPAGGLIGAHFFGRLAGARDAITIDVGGTSADVGLIINGIVQQASRAEIAGMPVRIPFLDIQTVGAGWRQHRLDRPCWRPQSGSSQRRVSPRAHSVTAAEERNRP